MASFKWPPTGGGGGGGGGGTVTSVGVSVPGSSIFGVSGSPVTTSGTIALTTTGTSGGIPYFSSSSALSSSGALTANALVLGGGAGTTPASLASLGSTTTVLHGNAAGAPTFGAVSLTADVSGILPVANGGSGVSTAFTAGSVIFAGAAGAYSQDNSNFFWDDTNNRLGLGSSAAPSGTLHVQNTVLTSIDYDVLTSVTGEAGTTYKTFNLEKSNVTGTLSGNNTAKYFWSDVQTVSGTNYGLWIDHAIPSGSTSTSSLVAMNVNAVNGGSGNISTLQGLTNLARNRVGAGSVTTFIGGANGVSQAAATAITNAFGTLSTVQNGNASSTMTNAYLYKTNALTNIGTITNTYGYYCDDVTTGTQTNQAYSFYASDANALNYFAGNTGIGTTAPSTLLHLGLAGTTLGTLGLAGNTSGLITVNSAAAAGTWTLTLPTSGGSSGQVLTTNGSGVTSWVTNAASLSIGDSIGSATAGSVFFAGAAGILAQDNSSFFYDLTNHRLGLVTTSPNVTFQVSANNNLYATTQLSDGSTSIRIGSVLQDQSYTTVNTSAVPIYGAAFRTLVNLASPEAVSPSVTGMIIEAKYASTSAALTQCGIIGVSVTATSANATNANSNLTGGQFTCNYPSTAAGNGTIMTGTINTCSTTTGSTFVLSTMRGNRTNLTHASATTVGEMSGIYSQISNTNASGIVTNSYGFYTLLNSNAGTITNTYGYYCADVTTGTQTNQAYSFYASDASALNYFAGKTGINQTAPASMLDIVTASSSTIGHIIKASASQSVDLFEVQNSSGVKQAYINSAGNFDVVSTGKYLFNAQNAIIARTDLDSFFLANAGNSSTIASYSGLYNVAIGLSALGSALTSGNRNMAIGVGALQLTSSGANCVAVGAQALQYNVTASNNTAIGYNSLSGSNGIGDGANNIGIGSGAGTLITSGSKNLVIAYNGEVPSATASNQVNIGNVIWATGASGTGSTPTGLVGIGTNAPSTLLHLGLAGTTLGTLGLAGNTSGLITVNSAAAAGTWTFTLPNSGGTANYALTTNGSGVSTWAQISLTAGVTGILPVANGGSGVSTAFTAGSVIFAGAAGAYAQDNASLFFDDTNNRLGLGTNTPSTTFHAYLNATDFVKNDGLFNSYTNLATGATQSAQNLIMSTYTGTGTVPSALAIMHSKNNTTNNSDVTFGMYLESVIPASNTANSTSNIGLRFNVYNRGSGSLVQLIGISGLAVNQGGAVSSVLYGVSAGALNNAAVTVAEQAGVACTFQNTNASGVITNAKFFTTGNLNNSGTITNTYGYFCGDVTTGTQTNQAFSFYASDVNALNYFNGPSGFGTSAPAAQVHALLTTEQLRLGYDASNYVSYTVGSTGSLTVAGAGTNTGITFTNSGTGSFIHNSSVTTGATTASAFTLNANSLTTGTGFYAASSTLTTGKLVDLQVSGTAAAASQTALNILTAGATATNAITTYGSQISNTHTNATSGTNVALYLNASGATTANYGLIVNAGSVGVGTTAPGAQIQVNAANNVTIGSIIKGAASQASDLMQLQNSSGTVLSAFDSGGRLGVGTGIPNSTFSVVGNVSWYILTKTANYTAASDYTLLCDATSAAFTISLPPASSGLGRVYVIKKIDSTANAITVDGNASETIDGATTQAISAQWASLTIQSNGTSWFII